MDKSKMLSLFVELVTMYMYIFTEFPKAIDDLLIFLSEKPQSGTL